MSHQGFGEHMDYWQWMKVPFDSGTIANNEIQHRNLQHNSMLLMIKGDTWTGPWTVKNGNHHVITPNGGGSTPAGIRPLFVNVEDAAQAVLNKLKGYYPPEEAPKAAPDETVAKVTQVLVGIASALIGGVSTAFSAMGDKFAASAGIFGVISGIVGGVGGDGAREGPPPPPNLAQIKSTIMDVADTKAANEAATQFAATYDWFSSAGQEIASIKGKPPENLINTFTTRLEGALDSSDDSSFAYTLAYVRDNPSICMHILPVYMLATGLYITLSRIDFAWTYFPRSTNKKPAKGSVSSYAIQRLLNNTNQLRTGLQNARDYFFSERNNAVVSTGLQKTPEAIVPIKVFTKHYLGDEYAAPDLDYAMKFPKGSDFLANVDLSLKDSTGATYTLPKVGQGYVLTEQAKPDPIKTSLTKLDNIVRALEDDLATVKAGGWPTHLLNIDWDAEA